MSLVVEILGLLPGHNKGSLSDPGPTGPIGSRIDSKSAYIMNGTLNWNCPSEYSTTDFICVISILTNLLSLQ